MPMIPQSKVPANFLQKIGERCGEFLEEILADFRPSISRENDRKKFHAHSAPNKVLSSLQLWERGGHPKVVALWLL